MPLSRRLAAVLIAPLMLLATAVITGATARPASAATGAIIKGVKSGRCLDVDSVARSAGTGMDIYDCNNQVNQAWTLTAAGELKVYDSSTCLDVKGKQTTSPATLEIWPCNAQTNQKWTLNADGSIVGVQSGLCLDVKYSHTENSALVWMYTCNGTSTQRWTTTLGAADTIAPITPTGAQTSALSCTSVHFSWNAATDNVGVAF